MKRVAVVTGATGGIGSAICPLLAKNGFHVVGTYFSSGEDKIKTWENRLGKSGTLYPLDIRDYEGCQGFCEEVKEKFDTVGLLVNNAAITRDALFVDMSEGDWSDVLNTNLLALYNITQPIFCMMSQAMFGRIVNISSVNGQRGQIGQANYCASKAGVHGFTKALAMEGARYNISVNTVCSRVRKHTYGTGCSARNTGKDKTNDTSKAICGAR